MIKAGAHEYVMKDNLEQLPPAVRRELQAAQDRCIRRGTIATEGYLASIVQQSDTAIFGQTLDGRIVSWNAGAERLYGYSPCEILGASASILLPNHRPPEQIGISERINQGQQVPSFETVHVCKNGTKVAVSMSVSAVRDARGRVIGVSTIAEDISRRKEEERERLSLIQDLTAALANSLDATCGSGARVVPPK
jgi:PAS domain S-box-containing protein